MPFHSARSKRTYGSADALQAACFDTAFHRGRAEVVDGFAIPEPTDAEEVLHYGFHGLSYECISRRLGEVAPKIAKGRIVVAIFALSYVRRFSLKVMQMKTISVEKAVSIIPHGARLMIGGFMGVGTPERLMDEMVRQGKRDLTVIANDTAKPGTGIGKLVGAKLVRTAIVSHIGLNPETQQQMIAGQMTVELVPQGTLVERIRAGGNGLGGVLTPTGVGTVVEEGKRKIAVDGEDFLLETPLRADFALIHSFLADYLGNLSYALTARNFNPVMAMAGSSVIADAEHFVPVGVIAPDHVITPAPLVDYIVANA